MKKIFLIFIVGIFMISLVSSLDIDNVKLDIGDEQAITIGDVNVDYNSLWETYEPLEIKNWLGLGETFFSGAITEHTETCGINCMSELEVYTSGDYPLISDIYFETILEDGKRIHQNIRSYKLFYYTEGEQIEVNDYEIVCEDKITLNETRYKECNSVVTGTSLENSLEWTEFKVGDYFEEGNYKIKLVGEKKPSRAVDWIIKTSGETLTEWATWGNISQGDDAEVILNSPSNDSISYSNEVEFNASANITNGAYLVNVSLWTNESGSLEVRNTTNFSEVLIYDNFDSGLLNGLKHYYKADEQTGDLVDALNLLNLTESGTIGSNDGVSIYSRGPYSTSSNFDGTSSNFSIGTDIPFTINYYYYGPTNNTNRTLVEIISPDTTNDMTLTLEISSNNKLRVYSGYRATTTITFENSNVIDANNWTMLTLDYYSDRKMGLCVNGICENSSNAHASGSDTDTNIISLGARNDNIYPLSNSDADEVAFWLRSLDQEEINQLMVSSLNSTTQVWNRTISGNTLWNVEACDSDGDCGFAEENRTLFLDVSPPQISISYPSGIVQSFAFGNNLSLNYSINDTNVDSCWVNYNATNRTINCSAINDTFTPVEGLKNLTIFANDTTGNINYQSTSWTYGFVENSVLYNESVFETSSQYFELNITTDINILSMSAGIYYNGTRHSSDVSCDGGNCTISNNLDIPLVIGGNSENKSFFWNLEVYNGTSSININTSLRYQNISVINLELCNGTFTVEAINFTPFEEKNMTQLPAFDFDATFQFWLGSGMYKKNSSFIERNVSNVTICISPGNETFFHDTQIEYTSNATSDSYVTRNYFFENATLTNDTQAIQLISLQSALSTSFILETEDESVTGVEGALIFTQKYYPGENLFRNVQVAKTDSGGKSVGFFEAEIIDYKFIVVKNGEVLLITEKKKVVGESVPYTITLSITSPEDAPWGSYDGLENLVTSLTINETTDIIEYTYIDTSGSLSVGRLVVEEEVFSNSSQIVICNTSSTQSSATLTCNVSTITGKINARGFIGRSPEVIVELKSFIVDSARLIFGNAGLLLGTLIILAAYTVVLYSMNVGLIIGAFVTILVNISPLMTLPPLFVWAHIGLTIVVLVVINKR